jgi:hypothetical protein
MNPLAAGLGTTSIDAPTIGQGSSLQHAGSKARPADRRDSE